MSFRNVQGSRVRRCLCLLRRSGENYRPQPRSSRSRQSIHPMHNLSRTFLQKLPPTQRGLEDLSQVANVFLGWPPPVEVRPPPTKWSSHLPRCAMVEFVPAAFINLPSTLKSVIYSENASSRRADTLNNTVRRQTRSREITSHLFAVRTRGV